MEKNFENGGLAMPKMTIMPPTVINEDGTGVPPQNVASEGTNPPEWAKEHADDYPVKPEIEYVPATKESYDGSKHQFLLDDEMAHMPREQKIDSFDFDHTNLEGK